MGFIHYVSWVSNIFFGRIMHYRYYIVIKQRRHLPGGPRAPVDVHSPMLMNKWFRITISRSCSLKSSNQSSECMLNHHFAYGFPMVFPMESSRSLMPSACTSRSSRFASNPSSPSSPSSPRARTPGRSSDASDVSDMATCGRHGADLMN